LFGAADLGPAPRPFLLHLAQLARNVGGRRLQCEQAGRVELDEDFACHAADARDRADAAHAEDGLGDRVIDEPGQRLVVHATGGHGIGQDRRAGEVDLADHRVLELAGQVSADAGDGIAHVVDRLLRRLFEAELDRHRGHAILHLGVDVLDALQRGHRVLDLARHLGFHLRRCGAGQRGGDGDHGQVDVHELLDFHGAEGHQAEQREQDEQQDGRHRVPDRPGRKRSWLLFGSDDAPCRHRRGSRRRWRRPGHRRRGR
jgi:hypothetical protein